MSQARLNHCPAVICYKCNFELWMLSWFSRVCFTVSASRSFYNPSDARVVGDGGGDNGASHQLISVSLLFISSIFYLILMWINYSNSAHPTFIYFFTQSTHHPFTCSSLNNMLNPTLHLILVLKFDKAQHCYVKKLFAWIALTLSMPCVKLCTF